MESRTRPRKENSFIFSLLKRKANAGNKKSIIPIVEANTKKEPKKLDSLYSSLINSNIGNYDVW